ANLLTLDIDRADDVVEGCIRQVRRLADGRIVHLRPQGAESLALRDPPAGIASAHCVIGADIDVDAADLQGAGAVERKDSSFAGFELRVNRAGNSGDREQQDQEDGKTTAQHARGLLAITAWKSKRDVASRPSRRRFAKLTGSSGRTFSSIFV